MHMVIVKYKINTMYFRRNLKMILVEGTLLDALLLLVMLGSSLFYMNKASGGEKIPEIRQIPAVAAIEEGVGRSLELDKPIHFGMSGTGGRLYDAQAANNVAAFMLLLYVAKLSARYGAKLIVHMPGYTESIAVIQGLVRQAYFEEGVPEMLDSNADLRYYGRTTTTLSQSIAISYARDGVGLNVLVGKWSSDCVAPLESSIREGGFNVGGTGTWIMTYAFAMMSDYTLIGQELFAAAAKVSGNEQMISSVIAEDIGKAFMIVITVVGVILAALGVDVASLFAM